MAMTGCLRSTLPLISKALTSDLISFRGSSLQRSLLCPTLTNPEVSASMKDLCYDKFGISKEKKDSKNVKGNRDLLDELPEKWRIEERGYLSDDGEEQSACYCSFYYCTCLVMAFYFTY